MDTAIYGLSQAWQLFIHLCQVGICQTMKNNDKYGNERNQSAQHWSQTQDIHDHCRAISTFANDAHGVQEGETRKKTK